MKKNILVIGGGGREHAICKKLKESAKVDKLYCLPGNAGIAKIAVCDTSIKATDFEGIFEFLKSHTDINLVFVAPDDPLAAGLVDELTEKGYRAFGPSKAAAQIEASKSFSKKLMKKYGIPTAAYAEFTSLEKAVEYVKQQNIYPTVIKADGLALGKGVIIAQNEDEAVNALNQMFGGRFGDAGRLVVIEEFMTGSEVTVLAFADGEHIVPMVSSKDHKRIFDGDKGENTGGMGAISPAPLYTKQVEEAALKTIINPTMNALKAEGIPFKGVIYFGLMLTSECPKVVEYNARFGDPEAEVVLPRLKTDLVDIIDACIDGTLDKIDVKWSESSAACVVLASEGYPGSTEKGLTIQIKDCGRESAVYHCGTALKDGQTVTNGGRVLCISATAGTLDAALDKCYNKIKDVTFKGMQYRKDIGKAK